MTGTWAWLSTFSPPTCSSETIYWTAPGGSAINLNDRVNYKVLKDLDGRKMPQFEPVTTDLPYACVGDKIKFMKPKPREVFIPIQIFATTRATFLTKIRALTSAFDPMMGEGTLTFCSADNSRRIFKCQLIDVEQGESEDTVGNLWQVIKFRFSGSDPYLYDPTVKSQALLLGSNPTTVTSNGDSITWPKFIATGTGMTAILFTNKTFDPDLGIDCHFSSTTSYTVITWPREMSAVNAAGASVMSGYLTYSVFFPLLPGANSVQFDYAASSPAATIYWYDAYNGI